MQQELRATQGSLELERQHVVSLQREVRSLQLEASSTQAAWRDEKETAESSVKKANGKQSPHLPLHRKGSTADRVNISLILKSLFW